MLHGITPLADYHSIYENLSLCLFFCNLYILFYLAEWYFCFMNAYSWNKNEKKWIYCFFQNKDGNFPLIRERKRNICSFSEVDQTMKFVSTYLRTTDCFLKNRCGHFIRHLKRERDLGQISIPNRIALQRIENKNRKFSSTMY